MLYNDHYVQTSKSSHRPRETSCRNKQIIINKTLTLLKVKYYVYNDSVTGQNSNFAFVSHCLLHNFHLVNRELQVFLVNLKTILICSYNICKEGVVSSCTHSSGSCWPWGSPFQQQGMTLSSAKASVSCKVLFYCMKIRSQFYNDMLNCTWKTNNLSEADSLSLMLFLAELGFFFMTSLKRRNDCRRRNC